MIKGWMVERDGYGALLGCDKAGVGQKNGSNNFSLNYRE